MFYCPNVLVSHHLRLAVLEREGKKILLYIKYEKKGAKVKK